MTESEQTMITVLLIEDYPDNARLVARTLEPHGYKVLHACDGASGLELAAQTQPDVILIDLGLPDMEGETLVAFMRRQPHLAHVPLIAVTAWPPDTARQMAVAYGFDGYISKPINPRQFPAEIAAYVNPIDAPPVH